MSPVPPASGPRTHPAPTISHRLNFSRIICCSNSQCECTRQRPSNLPSPDSWHLIRPIRNLRHLESRYLQPPVSSIDARRSRSRRRNRRHELDHNPHGLLGPRLHRSLAHHLLQRPGAGHAPLQEQRRLLPRHPPHHAGGLLSEVRPPIRPALAPSRRNTG